MILEKQLLPPIDLGRVIRPFPNYLEAVTLQAVANLPKNECSDEFIPRSDSVTLRESAQQTARATSQTLKASNNCSAQ